MINRGWTRQQALQMSAVQDLVSKSNNLVRHWTISRRCNTHTCHVDESLVTLQDAARTLDGLAGVRHQAEPYRRLTKAAMRISRLPVALICL